MKYTLMEIVAGLLLFTGIVGAECLPLCAVCIAGFLFCLRIESEERKNGGL